MKDIKTYTAIIIASLSLIGLLVALNPAPHHNLHSQEQAQTRQYFNSWMDKFAKKYPFQSEKLYRFNNFRQNIKFIRNHNNKYENGQQTFQVGVNQFADLDLSQFTSTFLMAAPSGLQATKQCKGTVQILDPVPFDEDWSPRAVTPVKNQGSCTAAWAFSAVGALQGLASLTQRNIFNFSAQQLVDCTNNEVYGNQGCNGGEVQNSFWYVKDNGITTQEKYPYVGTNQVCNYTSALKVFQIGQCARVKPNSTRALESALIKQPVSVMVESNSLAFQLYKRGIFSGKCGSALNHAMVLTGYGHLNDENYWKCKNSWGLSWGQQGYIFLRRDKKQENAPGQCGILMKSFVPLE